MIQRLAAILIFCVAMLPASALAYSRDLDQAMLDAERKLAAGEYSVAEQTYREIIRDYPGFAEAYGGLATALTRQQRSEEAGLLLLEAGQGLVQTDEVELGIRYLERAAELTPASSAIRAALGYALLQGNRHREAIVELHAAVDQGADQPIVRLYLAASYWEAGQFDEAEAAYRRLVSAQGSAGSAARRSLGALLLFRGQPERALPILLTALGEDPQSSMLRFDLARAFEEAGRVVEAREMLESLLMEAPDFYQAHYRLARLYRRLGDVERAAAESARFQELHDENQRRTRAAGREEARLLKGWTTLRAGRIDEAVELFSSLPATADTLRGLAEAHYQAGRSAEAIDLLQRLLRMDPERGDIELLIDRWKLAGASR
jgi:predicted Zn-dependent protease